MPDVEGGDEDGTAAAVSEGRTGPPVAPAALVGRAQAGDVPAFTEAVRRYDDRLRGLAYKLLGGDAQRMDDVLQEAYLRAFRALPRFRHDAGFGTWLHRIVANTCIDELRRSGRRPEPVDIASGWERPAATPGPEALVVGADVTLRALASLPPDQRSTVVLVDGEGLDHREAAELLGVAPGTIASRLSRARAHLRRALQEEDS